MAFLLTEDTTDGRIFQNNVPLQKGDCIMIGPEGPDQPYRGPVVIFQSNGKGYLQGFGRSTDDDDAWQISIQVYNPDGRYLFGKPTDWPLHTWRFDMGHDNQWYQINQEFDYDANLLSQIGSVNYYCNC